MRNKKDKTPNRLHRGFILLCGLFCLLCGATFGTLRMLAETRHHVQMQNDPQVATVWTLGVTQGANHALARGTTLQKWLNDYNIHLLGDYSAMKSRFSGENPNALQFWFDYDSHLAANPLLECHRIGEAAFFDDLGQPYHGYLDFQGKVVGVYLPGYDHAARRITCAVHWMPRRPSQSQATSSPMLFTVDLPPARRVLPPARALLCRTLTLTQLGITVTVGDLRLSGPKLSLRRRYLRDLTFCLKVTGGQLVAGNMDAEGTLEDLRLADDGSIRLFRARLHPTFPRLTPPVSQRFVITDPYGISLVPEKERITPLLVDDRPLHDSRGTFWSAPILGGGRGTDAIRLRFEVRPQGSPTQPTIPFDVTLPVQTDDEV